MPLVVIVPQPINSAIHCINPSCPHPYPQPWGNKFCNSCGSPLLLKNRYIPLQRLGSGGFATIYTVWDLHTATERVLKVLMEASPKALELFEQEASVLASLNHPGVPKVNPDGYFQVNVNREQLLPCLVMEKINGETLEEILTRYPQGCPEDLVISWLNQAVDILRELHSRHIIHRDIKPSNLMLRQENGQLVVIDFGGAKQIASASLASGASSTRLISTGYSPPEQMAGGVVGPSADFYALGRTMIQLLTGKYPSDLEDPLTGDFRWRKQATVSPSVANLLDELVREDVRRRPTSAVAIQARLLRIAQKQANFSKLVIQMGQTGLAWSWIAIAFFTKGISNTTLLLLRGIIQIIRACLDTAWGMVLGALGAFVGTTAGFILAYVSSAGAQVAGFFNQQLPVLVPGTHIGPEILLFACSGFGTAWGLTAAGGFGQRRRYLVATVMGILAYGLGWFVLQTAGSVAGGITVAIALLTLGLGLPSHHLAYAVITSLGTTTIFAALVNLNLLSAAFFNSTQPSWEILRIFIIFSGLMGIITSFWLGVSHYLIVPCLRLLGWR